MPLARGEALIHSLETAVAPELYLNGVPLVELGATALEESAEDISRKMLPTAATPPRTTKYLGNTSPGVSNDWVDDFRAD